MEKVARAADIFPAGRVRRLSDFFRQLRIADEFKDFEKGDRDRPYRPEPRGFVKLKELAATFAAVRWLKPALVFALLGVGVCLTTITKEFYSS